MVLKNMADAMNLVIKNYVFKILNQKIRRYIYELSGVR